MSSNSKKDSKVSKQSVYPQFCDNIHGETFKNDFQVSIAIDFGTDGTG